MSSGSWRTQITRREAMRLGLAGAAGLVLGGHLAFRPAGAATLAGAATSTGTAAGAALPSPKGKAKAVIQIWMWGGPSHLDTFDPKPAAGNDYCGPLNSPIATNVNGIIIGELLPLLAKQADRKSVV
jgi:hypothetical protein